MNLIGKEEFLSYIPIQQFKKSLRVSYILELVNDYNLFETLEQKYSFSTVSNFKVYLILLSVLNTRLNHRLVIFILNIFKTLTDYVRMFKESRKLFDNF